MEHKARSELVQLIQDALRLGGAPIEMRVRRLASFLRNSDPELAEEIAPLVSPTRALREVPQTLQAPLDSDSRQSLVAYRYPVQFSEIPVYGHEVQASLDRLLLERRAADRLLNSGLVPTRSVLLSGPPGVGKTLAAQWLARELDLPLLTLDLATVMSSYLGKTGSNVRSVLLHAQEQPCVLLLDEFDSIAKRRNDDLDLGELKRLVTVLLQAIDEWPHTSLLVAATNHPELLDAAVWRRFDMTVQCQLPSLAERQQFLVQADIEDYLASVIAAETEGASLAVLSRMVKGARKAELLGLSSFETALLDSLVGIENRDAGIAPQKGKRKSVAQEVEILKGHYEGCSSREIAEAVNSSHTHVNRVVKRVKGAADGGSKLTHRSR